MWILNQTPTLCISIKEVALPFFGKAGESTRRKGGVYDHEIHLTDAGIVGGNARCPTVQFAQKMLLTRKGSLKFCIMFDEAEGYFDIK